MPAVALAAVAGGLTASVSTGALVFGFSVTNALVAGGLALIGTALTPKPKKPSAPNFTATAQDRKFLIRSTVAPRRIIYGRAKVAGALVYAATSGPSSEYLHLVVALAGHQCEGVDKIFLNDEELPALDGDGNVTSGKYASNVRINVHLGSATQAACPNLLAEIDEWTADHRLRGVTYAHIRLTAVRNLWPTGIPEVRFILQGKNDIYDPRDLSSGWTDNAALCQRDYITGPLGLGDSDVNDPSWATAASRCDELVTKEDATSEKRYTINGAFELDAQPLDLLEDLMSASAGRAVFAGGVWRGYAAGYESAVKTITADDLRGSIKVSPRPARGSLFNGVRGTFIDDRDDLYSPTDFPAVTNSVYESEDSEQILRDIELPFTVGHERAQRVAKVELERHRQGVTAVVPLKTMAHELLPWDMVAVTIDLLGWTAKEFRVIDWELGREGGVNLTLQEDASAVYDWNNGDATQFDPAPNTRLPSPFDVTVPDALVLTESLYSAREGGGLKAKLIATWAAPPSAYVRQYEVQHKPPGATEFGDSRFTASTSIEFLDAQAGTHEVRVASMNGLNITSDFVTKTLDLQGLAAVPADITGLSLQVVGGVAIARFDQHPDLDVRIGGVIVCRHSSAQSGAEWNASRIIGRALTGNQTVYVLPAMPGTYLFKARDSSGIYSDAAVSASTKGANVSDFTTLDTLTEGTTFSGTHTNTVGVGSVLKLTSDSGGIDAWGNIDDVANIDAEGGVAASGTYVFAAGIDLSSVKNVRLMADYQATVTNVIDQWDDRGGNIDDWPAVDGDIQGDEADVFIECRETDDDPTGSPTWSDWQQLDVADYNARAFEFRAQLSSSEPIFNVETGAITITAEEIT